LLNAWKSWSASLNERVSDLNHEEYIQFSNKIKSLNDEELKAEHIKYTKKRYAINTSLVVEGYITPWGFEQNPDATMKQQMIRAEMNYRNSL
jgi:ribosomal protein S8